MQIAVKQFTFYKAKNTEIKQNYITRILNLFIKIHKIDFTVSQYYCFGVSGDLKLVKQLKLVSFGERSSNIISKTVRSSRSLSVFQRH